MTTPQSTMSTSSAGTSAPTTTTTSTYKFVPSTAGAAASMMLAITEAYVEGLMSQTSQLLNELTSQFGFAKAAAKQLRQQGKNGEQSALWQGCGQIGQGLGQVGSGAAMSVSEQPVGNEGDESESTTANRNMRVEEAAADSEEKSPAEQQEAAPREDELKLQSEREESEKQANQRTSRQYRETPMSHMFAGIGAAFNGIGTIVAGTYTREQQRHAAKEKLDSYGQSAADGMVSQYMQQFNALASSLNQVYSLLAQVAQANNSR